MNSWLIIRRLRWPAILLLFGVTALLHEWNILSFGQSWPLYLILIGVLLLAERAAFAQQDPSQMPPYGGTYPPPQPSGWQTPPPPAPGTSITPAAPAEIDRTEGGR